MSVEEFEKQLGEVENDEEAVGEMRKANLVVMVGLLLAITLAVMTWNR